MGAHLVVVGGVGFENPTQVRFARNHQVVKTFAANRTDDSLDVPVLPR
jgi:hypothetical protein